MGELCPDISLSPETDFIGVIGAVDGKTINRAFLFHYGKIISSIFGIDCRVCARQNPDHAEPLQPTPLPDRPWQRAAADLCEIDNKIRIRPVPASAFQPESGVSRSKI